MEVDDDEVDQLFDQSPSFRASFSPDQYQALKRAWVNEQQSPELLAFRADLLEPVGRFILQNSESEEDVKVDPLSSDHDRMARNLTRLHIERVSYLVTCYLRSRLSKIERNVLFIASDPSSLQQLSNAERKFVAEYASLYSGYLEATFTSKLPAPLQSLPSQMIKEPNLQKHVVMSVVDDMGDVMMDTGETVSLFSGSVLVARYQPLRSLIRNGRIDLL